MHNNVNFNARGILWLKKSLVYFRFFLTFNLDKSENL